MFIFEPQPPPQGIEIPKEGKAKAKERREVGEGDDTVIVEDTSEEGDDDDEEEETLQDRCGQGLAVPACLMYLSCKTPRLAWRLVWLRRHGSRATPPASG
jgi:hypothetical protein